MLKRCKDASRHECGVKKKAEHARQILEIDPLARLIVSSGYSSDPIMSDYLRYGFSAAVAKPYKVSELGQALKALADLA